MTAAMAAQQADGQLASLADECQSDPYTVARQILSDIPLGEE